MRRSGIRGPGSPFFLPPAIPLGGFQGQFQDGFEGSILTPTTIPTDGPDSVYVPETVAQWASLSLVAPNSQHLMQSLASPVPDIMDGRDLQATGAPAFGQPGPAGWNGLFIDLDDGVVESLVYNSTAAYNPALDDVLELNYTNFTASGSNARQFVRLGNGGIGIGSGAQLLRARTDGTIEVRNNGTGVNATLDHRGQVRPYLTPYDRSNVMGLGAGYWGLFSDIERVDGPVDLTSINATTKGLGGVGAAGAPAVEIRLHCTWYAANARAMMAIGMKTILQRLRWPVTGY